MNFFFHFCRIHCEKLHLTNIHISYLTIFLLHNILDKIHEDKSFKDIDFYEDYMYISRYVALKLVGVIYKLLYVILKSIGHGLKAYWCGFKSLWTGLYVFEILDAMLKNLFTFWNKLSS